MNSDWQIRCAPLPAGYAGRSRRFAARMAELTASNAWSAPLRCANQSFDRQNPLNNQMLPIRYSGEPAGQLGH